MAKKKVETEEVAQVTKVEQVDDKRISIRFLGNIHGFENGVVYLLDEDKAARYLALGFAVKDNSKKPSTK